MGLPGEPAPFTHSKDVVSDREHVLGEHGDMHPEFVQILIGQKESLGADNAPRLWRYLEEKKQNGTRLIPFCDTNNHGTLQTINPASAL